MVLFFATAVTMVAFAANSILTRLAIEGGYMDPAGFAILRVISGAVVLALVIGMRGRPLPLFTRERVSGTLSLAAYLVGFSLAYLTLDAGLGALILFGGVQITMFAHGAVFAKRPTVQQICGGGVAFSGLLVALWPGAGGGEDVTGIALMIFAGLGWAVYSIIGRGARDPLAATGANFLLSVPVLVLLLASSVTHFTLTGFLLGCLCGGLTSGLGYTLWYWVLPQLDGAVAAIVQLSVPIIAIIAGALFLGEAIGTTVLLATVLVVGGIGWSAISQSAQVGRKKSPPRG